MHKQGDSVTDYDQQDWPPRDFLFNNERRWHRCDYFCSAEAGRQAVWINGKKYEYEFSKDPAASSNSFYTRLIGYDVSQSAYITETLRHRLSEFYEQPSLARVELSNSLTYDDSIEQKRIYQITEERTDSAVRFRAYYADLNKNDAIYAHIVRSDGTAIDWGRIN